MPNCKLTDTQERTVGARRAFAMYLKRYGGNDGITPEEYMAELEYLFEVFKVKPTKTLYSQAKAMARR